MSKKDFLEHIRKRYKKDADNFHLIGNNTLFYAKPYLKVQQEITYVFCGLILNFIGKKETKEDKILRKKFESNHYKFVNVKNHIEALEYFIPYISHDAEAENTVISTVRLGEVIQHEPIEVINHAIN